jgi:hypothetical protein
MKGTLCYSWILVLSLQEVFGSSSHFIYWEYTYILGPWFYSSKSVSIVIQKNEKNKEKKGKQSLETL